jgi:hypothetical protein
VPGLCLMWLPQTLLVLWSLTGIPLPIPLVVLAAMSSEVCMISFRSVNHKSARLNSGISKPRFHVVRPDLLSWAIPYKNSLRTSCVWKNSLQMFLD